MIPLLVFIAYLVSLYEFVVIAAVILSWLMQLQIINAYNPFVRSLWQAISAVTEPLLRLIRPMLPTPGGLDLSPLVLLLALLFLRSVVIHGWIIPLFQ